MNKKELIFPGVIFALVIIIALVLIIGHGGPATPLPGEQMASSTASTTESTKGNSSHASTSTGSGSTGTAANGSYYPYGQVTLSVNQVAGFQDGLSMRPLAVLEDSRCPKEVQCVQAGTVHVQLKTNILGKTTTQVILLGQSIQVGRDTVSLVAVSPARSTAGPIASSEYHLTFAVKPGAATTVNPGRCYVGGCSSELCTDEPGAVSTCVYHSQYACYKGATCERQVDGSCGWTQTAALATCLAHPPA